MPFPSDCKFRKKNGVVLCFVHFFVLKSTTLTTLFSKVPPLPIYSKKKRHLFQFAITPKKHSCF